MKEIPEGNKRELGFAFERLRGTGAVPLVTPQRRILNSGRTVVAGFDWAAASWDSDEEELYALFDSTAVGLTAVGTYYLQLRGTIGSELYQGEITVNVVEVGP